MLRFCFEHVFCFCLFFGRKRSSGKLAVAHTARGEAVARLLAVEAGLNQINQFLAKYRDSPLNTVSLNTDFAYHGFVKCFHSPLSTVLFPA